jgi:hypothetical protein
MSQLEQLKAMLTQAKEQFTEEKYAENDDPTHPCYGAFGTFIMLKHGHITIRFDFSTWPKENIHGELSMIDMRDAVFDEWCKAQYPNGHPPLTEEELAEYDDLINPESGPSTIEE